MAGPTFGENSGAQSSIVRSVCSAWVKKETNPIFQEITFTDFGFSLTLAAINYDYLNNSMNFIFISNFKP